MLFRRNNTAIDPAKVGFQVTVAGLPKETDFQVVASSRVEGLPAASFDVALANPPYYAQSSIARLFIERSRVLLRPGGRLYLVTKRPDQVGPIMADVFGPTEVVTRRGYSVLCAGGES